MCKVVFRIDIGILIISLCVFIGSIAYKFHLAKRNISSYEDKKSVYIMWGSGIVMIVSAFVGFFIYKNWLSDED